MRSTGFDGDDNEAEEAYSLDGLFPWTQKERLYSLARELRNYLLSSLQWGHNLLRSRAWGRKLEDYILIKPQHIPGRIGIFVALTVVALLWLIHIMHAVPRVGNPTKLPLLGTHFTKPEQAKIYGIVFYGRHATVEILDCYLRKNLVSNGGWLDAVHFIINTDDEADLAWIDNMVGQVRDYKKIEMDEGTDPRDYEKVWRQAVQPGHLYVKFDDDLVWMSDTAVEETITTLINHPEAFLVLANLVNSAALGWVHHHQGAIHAYLPQLEPPLKSASDSYGPKAWRASALPSYQPAEGSDEIIPFPDTEKDFAGARAEIGDIGGPPYANHRWLPLRDNGTLLPLTPIWRTEYAPNSADWCGWQLGAQQHYSLLQNIESDDLSAYHFGDKDGLWNMRYMHANINLMAVWADDILDNLPFDVEEDDEAHFSIHLPKKFKRQTYIQTKAIASHFSFGPQRELYDTDLLSRYRAYANEKVCGKRNQIPVPKDLDGGRTDRAR